MSLAEKAKTLLSKSIYESRRGCDLFGNGDGRISRNSVVIQGRKVGECVICYETGYRFDCNNYICNDCFLDDVWTKLSTIKPVVCFGCKYVFSTKEILEIGQPSDLEASFISIAASINEIDGEDYVQCPTCKSFVERASVNDIEVTCLICKTSSDDATFCWMCKKKWNNPSSHTVCGNPECSTTIAANIVSSTLTNTDYVVIGGKKVPKTRKCPNCSSLVEWGSACNSVLCKCGVRFCISCLSRANAGSHVALCGSLFYMNKNGYIQCNVAPTQK